MPAIFLPVGDVPFEWLFPRMSAVVHSGGAGSAAAGMRAGIPNITVPFFSDQPFWARRAAAAGAGPPPIPPKELTAQRLAGAIMTAVNDPRFASRRPRSGKRSVQKMAFSAPLKLSRVICRLAVAGSAKAIT